MTTEKILEQLEAWLNSPGYDEESLRRIIELIEQLKALRQSAELTILRDWPAEGKVQ